MQIINTIIHIIELLIYIYLGFAAFYILFFATAGLFATKSKKISLITAEKFAVLIPGYKEDNVILEVAQNAILQKYPHDKFDVIVIADSFKKETILKLKALPIIVIEVSFEKSTKSKALNTAISQLSEEYKYALVLDADNLMEAELLQKMNFAFSKGFIAVQAHRTAKNLNTSFAILDAVSEEINNHIFRKGHRVVGLSSALIGSGMAFEYNFFKEIMSKINAVGGFDKELELRMLSQGEKIEYLHDAIVLDEKVQKAEVFTNQRKRWLSAQFIYFGKWFFPGLKQFLFKGNIDLFDKVYQMVQPPRILLLGLLLLFNTAGLISYFVNIESINKLFLIPFKAWFIILIATFFAFLFSIPRKFYSLKTLKAIILLPKGFALMLISLFKLKGANKKFIHTQHGTH